LLLLERVPLAPILLLELPLPVFFVTMIFSIHSPRRQLKRLAGMSFPTSRHNECSGGLKRTHPHVRSDGMQTDSQGARDIAADILTKVPAVTLGFWIIKILATTLGETGGDTVTMSWLGETTPHPVPGGYLIGTAIFGILLIALVWAQIRARAFRPWLYWATIVASTTAGTTLADFVDRSESLGYLAGSLLLFVLVLASLFAWKATLGTVDVNTVTTPRQEGFYWLTITFSQTLGTALGDWVADAGLGYEGGALLFGAGLAVLAILYFTRRANHVFLFWAAFILTRPLGATVGDLLDKPVASGGLDFSRPLASAVLLVVIVALIVVLPQRAGRHPGSREAAA